MFHRAHSFRGMLHNYVYENIIFSLSSPLLQYCPQPKNVRIASLIYESIGETDLLEQMRLLIILLD